VADAGANAAASYDPGSAMHEPYTITFPEHRSAVVVEVDAADDLDRAAHALGLKPRPTVVLVGGAAGLTVGDAADLGPLFHSTVAPLVEELGAQVIDGGTDVGVMQLIGRARHELGLGFPLIGVAARGNVSVPRRDPANDTAASLEPNHSHFLLVPGTGWGLESPWISRLATTLSAGEPSLTLLVHGGEITWRDASESVAAERPVVVVADSGGAATTAADHLRGGAVDGRTGRLAGSGLLVAVDIDDAPDSATATIRRLLGAKA
jgi:hypothetical protein